MKYILTSAILLVSHFAVIACDICGCAAGAMSSSMLPFQSNHFVGFNYSEQHFNSTHNNLFTGFEESSSDVFRSLDLRMRYAHNASWNLVVSIPIKQNETIATDNRTINQGLGDISAQFNYRLLSFGSSKTVKQLTWMGGLGIKLPTGKFELSSELGNLPALQLGTGSIDGLLSSSLFMRNNALGIMAESSYQINTINSSGYQFGNKWNSTILMFYKFKREKLSIWPEAGISYFNKGIDTKYKALNIKNPYSGVNQLSITTGLDFYYQKLGLRALFNIPLKSNNGQGFVEPLISTQIQFLFLFNNFKKQSNEKNKIN